MADPVIPECTSYGPCPVHPLVSPATHQLIDRLEQRRVADLEARVGRLERRAAPHVHESGACELCKMMTTEVPGGTVTYPLEGTMTFVIGSETPEF